MKASALRFSLATSSEIFRTHAVRLANQCSCFELFHCLLNIVFLLRITSFLTINNTITHS